MPLASRAACKWTCETRGWVVKRSHVQTQSAPSTEVGQHFRPPDGQNVQAVAWKPVCGGSGSADESGRACFPGKTKVFVCDKRLEALDLRDLVQKRPPVDKAGLRARVRQVVAQQKSKAVAKNLVAGLIKPCRNDVAIHRRPSPRNDQRKRSPRTMRGISIAG